MRRVAFLYDGFNLYHSLCAASRDLSGAGTKWLDLTDMSRGLLHEVGGRAELGPVCYFSALANHVETTKPGAVARHRAYLEALAATGVEISLGRFKQRRSCCPSCGVVIVRNEEKESDVAMAVRLLELASSGTCGTVVLVSADSDLTPAVRAVQRRFPAMPVLACFPYGRGTHELRQLSRGAIRLRKERYVAHQLPDPVVTPDGRLIRKPAAW